MVGPQDTSSRFYEEYWKTPAKAPPAHDTMTQKRWDFLFKTLKYISAKNVLDVGCGDGRLVGVLLRHGYVATGMDISSNALSVAKSKVPEGRFVCYPLDGSPWPFPDKSFDVIVSFEVIEHLLGVRAKLEEVNRVLTNTGHLIVSTPYHGLIKNFLITLVRFEKHFDVEGGHIRFFTVNSLRRLLINTGFRVLYWRYCGRLWPIPKGVYVVARKVHEVRNRES